MTHLKTTRFVCRSARTRARGAILIESALVLPIVCVVMLLVTGSMIAWMQTIQAYIVTDASADRVAHLWGSSMSDDRGLFVAHDPLYHRTTEGLPMWLGGNGAQQSITLPDASPQSLYAHKLSRAQDRWPRAYRGEARVRTQMLYTVVDVRVRAPRLWARHTDASSSEWITDATEWLRHVRLMGFVLQNGAPMVARMKGMMAKFVPLKGALSPIEATSYRTHAEAVRAIRAWVRGTGARRPTKPVGHWRLIDALDRDGIAHQVYIGPKSIDVVDQLEKDQELLRTHAVRGVVWHFVQRTGETAFGPSAQLIARLREAGVLYVVHSAR
jgi:hypothetical protein